MLRLLLLGNVSQRPELSLRENLKVSDGGFAFKATDQTPTKLLSFYIVSENDQFLIGS